MRIAVALPQDNLRKVPAAARAAEAAGYDGVAAMENAHDPFLPLGAAALATERVELLTAVAIAFPRSPMAVAHAAWDLQEASGGRFVLGLGSQVKAHNERRYSVPWSPPAPRMAEYVEALRAIWDCWRGGGPLDYRGTHYAFTLMTPRFTPEGTGQPPVPVTIAAVGPAMLRLAGRLCDGVRLHPFCTRGYLEAFCLPRLGEGLARAGRPRARFEVTGGGFLATGPDEAAVARAMEEVRERVAFYGATRDYWPVLEMHGLGELGRKLNRMAREGRWAGMAREVPDEAVRLFAAVAPHAGLAAEVERRFGGLADTLYAGMLPTGDRDIPPDLIQDIRRIPSAFGGFGGG